jgi:hypothetical protein
MEPELISRSYTHRLGSRLIKDGVGFNQECIKF